jgi:pepF/M3 family oligoendopeptidase
MAQPNPPMKWNLEGFFAGGSDSPAFARFMDQTETIIAGLLHALQSDDRLETDGNTMSEWAKQLQQVQMRLRQADSFVACLTAQQVSDHRAVAWTERVQSLYAKYRQAGDAFDVKLGAMQEEAWHSWLQRPETAEIAFVLNERREEIRCKLPPALEALAGELAIDGYHGWGEHYGTIAGTIAIPWEEDGKPATLSAGQAANKLEHPDAAVRQRMMVLWESAWAEKADLCADTLNRLGGFRLKLNRLRGWNDILQEPLRMNRMSRSTLEAMWEAVEDSMAPLRSYLALKANLLGKQTLEWQDVDAPLSAQQSQIPYEKAASLITEAFAGFSDRLAALAERAFREHWIEAEDRPGKRAGGFCTDFPLSKETRIFMTYSGTPSNVSTLAHELGHAYHSELVFDLPPWNQAYAMNVAETASTFAEALVNDALLKNASTDEEKLALLDARLQNAVAFCMNIRARYLFETRFYEHRAKGMLDASALCELMVEAQREAYGDALASWHPHFWASKLHFYLTDVPFYNFPYTFGYLFSTGLVAIAEQEGRKFSQRYDHLLRDTGVMYVEELGMRHLGVRLDEPDFWRGAVARAVADVNSFEKLVRKKV